MSFLLLGEVHGNHKNGLTFELIRLPEVDEVTIGIAALFSLAGQVDAHLFRKIFGKASDGLIFELSPFCFLVKCTAITRMVSHFSLSDFPRCMKLQLALLLSFP
jgi:hypothetical protein